MAESRHPRLDRFGQWMFSPLGKLSFFVSYANLLALCVWGDELARSRGYESMSAPTREGLWIGIEFGGAIGAVGVLSGLLRRVFLRSGHASGLEPTGWRLCWTIILSGGPFLVCLLALCVWCVTVHVLPLPPLFAAVVVMYPGFRLLDLLFGPEPQDETAQAVHTGN